MSDYHSIGVRLIGEERFRQIDAEGWTPEHDDEHSGGEMLSAAACYIEVARALPLGADKNKLFSFSWGGKAWPWNKSWWKPSDNPIRNLEKAGALIAAEIDRLKRVKP